MQRVPAIQTLYPIATITTLSTTLAAAAASATKAIATSAYTAPPAAVTAATSRTATGGSALPAFTAATTAISIPTAIARPTFCTAAASPTASVSARLQPGPTNMRGMRRLLHQWRPRTGRMYWVRGVRALHSALAAAASITISHAAARSPGRLQPVPTDMRRLRGVCCVR